jgi:hypothetical protein
VADQPRWTLTGLVVAAVGWIGILIGAVGFFRNVVPWIRDQEWDLVVVGLLTSALFIGVGVFVVTYARRRGKR